ncbi:MAG: OmpA family protein [Moheibacter sp.]
MKTIPLSLLVIFGFQFSNAQILKNVGNRVKRTAENRIENEASKKTNEALDEVFDGKKDKSQKDKPQKDKSKNKEKSSKDRESENRQTSGQTEQSQNRSVNKSSDFEPGNQVLVFEDFGRDAMNDFPVNWNTNASGKTVSISGSSAKWLELTTQGSFILETVKNLPENFTLEFDLYVTPGYTYYDAPLVIVLGNLKSQKEFYIWGQYQENRGKEKRDGLLLTLHPENAGNRGIGFSTYEIWENGSKGATGKEDNLHSFTVKNNMVKVQIWRQNQRLRMYVGGEKIFDIPRAFDNGKKLNSFVLSRYESKVDNKFYVSNIRLATSGEDLRSKLLKEGRYSTNAILFNTASSELKPESKTVIQEIADVLKVNPGVRLKIIGHTDSDGDDAKNLKLSKDRAESVKNSLVNDYGISASRLETDGKGETEPVADNSTADGKAQNRRVEFLKL